MSKLIKHVKLTCLLDLVDFDELLSWATKEVFKTLRFTAEHIFEILVGERRNSEWDNSIMDGINYEKKFTD